MSKRSEVNHSETILEVQDLKTYFYTEDGVVKAVDGVDFSVKKGEVLGLVGESGCGKSVSSFSILRLVSPPGRITGGKILFEGKDILKLTKDEMVKVRGDRISMIFQQPQSSLNPVFRVGDQVAEVLMIHKGMKKKEAWDRAVELLTQVGIPDPTRKASAYPHEMSGGQAQRVMIAMAQPAPDYPLIPAPVVPPVSAPITAQNASQLARLVSLGEGDLINLQSSPDGKYVLVGTSTGILVLDSATLKRVSLMQSSMNPEEIYFFDDGRKVAALDRYHVRGHVWTFPEGEEIREVKMACNLDPTGQDRWWYSVPSKNLEFTFTYITNIAGLCNASTGEPLYILDYKINNFGFAISPDEKYLAFSTIDKLVVVQYLDGKVLMEIPETDIRYFFFYPDGKTMGAVFNNQVKFWDMTSMELIDTLNGVGALHDYDLHPMFSPDNSILVFRNENTYRLIRTIDREYINSVNGVGLEFTPDSRGFIVDNGSGQVNFYSVTEDRSGISLVNSVAGMGFNYGSEDHPGFLSEDKESLLVMKYWGQIGGWSQEIRIIDLPSGERSNFSFPPMGAGAPTDAVWIKGLRKFGILFSTGIVEFHTLDAKSESMYQVIGEIPGADRTEIKFTLSSDKLIYTRGDQVTIWDLNNNNYGYPKEGISAYTNFFIGNGKDRSPDGRYWISLYEKENPGYRKSILVTINGVLKEDYSGYSHLDYAFSPDSKLLAVSTFSLLRMTNVSIYDLSTGEKLFFSGDYFSEGDYAPKIAFSPDGNYIAILPQAGYPQIWGIP